ncbi:retrograde protein of 51 kDa [Patella vulgata]|uniref:retrograde protein of 51 kDa n=1 Tax=Patella vulgata TaxID=6465 RepID=UPI00217FC748|nr:retrograde protein of 51 kDa [Patella vulgata]
MSKSLGRSQESSGEFGEGYIKRRTTVIQRGGGPGSMNSSYGYSRQSNYGGGLNLAPGTYATMSHEGVSNMKDKRQHEKKEMQSLNERLGSYIEKVRFLEACITQLEQELEIYRNQKATDFKPIRDMYENELAQARKVIDELSAEKGGYDAKMAGLQDLVDTLRREVSTLEEHCNEYRTKIDNQASQIGGYEGELATLRLRIENLENENAKLRQLNNQRSEENRRLRTDLDGETAAHIEADCRATTLEEEVEFLRAILDKMPNETRQPVKIKGLDLEAFWQNNMAKAIRDIQNEYENRLDLMRQDMETRYSAQVS